MLKTSRFIKILIILIFGGLLYYQLTKGEGIEAVLTIWNKQKYNLRLTYLLLVIILMPFNWWLEALKWQKLMSPHQHITIKNSMHTILAGVAAGLVTPARIGEYAGRLITSDPSHKTQVISATLLGSISQNLCNIVGGLIFSYYFLKSVFLVTYHNQLTFIAIVTLQVGCLVGLYYNLPKVAHFIERRAGHRFILNYSSRLKSLDLYNISLLNIVLVISATRYIVYFLQYIFIMKFLGLDHSFGDLGGNIAGIYLIQTGIPLPAFLSIFARGEIAVIVWSGLGIDKFIALSATFALWFINLIIPALLGTVILYKTDIIKYLNSK